MNLSESRSEGRVEAKPETEVKEERKIDIKKLVAIIPPPTMLQSMKKSRQVQVKEKRIRLRYSPDVSPEEAKISPQLAKELDISDYLEITVAGRKRFKFKAIIDENTPYDIVFVNPDLMRQNGVADNSICTIRRART